MRSLWSFCIDTCSEGVMIAPADIMLAAPVTASMSYEGSIASSHGGKMAGEVRTLTCGAVLQNYLACVKMEQ